MKAWKALNKHTPTHHRYSSGHMINAQELEEPPYKLYKFTFYLNPICGAESCPREACTIDLKQNSDIEDDIETLNDSIQCMYFYSAEAQNDTSQEQQSYQDQEDSQITQESVTEQVNNNKSVELNHEIQETGDENIRPFIAMRASGNYCPGCPYELNPNLPSFLVFAEQALRLIDEQSASDYKQKLMSIVKVTRSVPVSSNMIQYQLLLLIGESECLKNALEQEQECPLRTTNSLKLCLITFEQQPWQPMSLKIIRNNCTDEEDSRANTSTQSQQPDLESQSLVTVKYNEGQSSSHSEVADAYEGLRDMLDNYTHASSTSSKQSEEAAVTESTIVKVVLNRSQDDEKIVDFTDKAKEFGEFLEHFDLPVKAEDAIPDMREPVKEEKFQRKKISTEDLKIEKANDRTDVVNRRKRSITKRGLVGAPTSISINDPEIQLFADKALHKVSEESDGPNAPLIVEISEASVQIVSGKLYKIKAKLGTSDCLKGTKNNCQLQAGSEVKDCLITAWSRPWIDQGSPEITVTCPSSSTSRKKRNLRGVNYNQKMLQIAEDVRTEQMFNEFVATYNRTYSTPEERDLRFGIFRENLGIIRLLRKTEQGTGRYGVNMFADVSREEFRWRYLGLRPDLRSENDIPLRKAEIPDVELPPSFDWRQKGTVTPVKDQGMCGSCWAFSVTGNVEGQYAIKHGQLLSLSEQELVDCDDLDEGCSGGLPDNAYRAIEKLGGLELESDYPYEAENEKCHFKNTLAKVQLASAVNITSDETQMAQWLVQNGPISIGINANAMQFYVGGVSHPFKFLCNPKNLDHGVLIVGYGTSNYPLFHKKLPYWIIKNSWGKHWGEQGYYRVYRGDGTCGLNMMATSAVVV